jgi:hypothetical protein
MRGELDRAGGAHFSGRRQIRVVGMSFFAGGGISMGLNRVGGCRTVTHRVRRHELDERAGCESASRAVSAYSSARKV